MTSLIVRYTISICTSTSTMAQLAASTPRRITRSSLARFAYTDARRSTDTTKSQNSHGDSTDIEDVIPDTKYTLPSATGKSISLRKRKRANASSSAPGGAPSLATRRVSKRRDATDSPDSEVKIDIKSEDLAATATTPLKQTKRQRKPALKTTDPATGQSVISAPTDWEEMYAAVQSMRSEGGIASNAPVDTMGCERLALSTASPRDQRYQTLVALMLSSQTKDTVNAIAMNRLQTELPPYKADAPAGLNLENMLAVSPAHLNELIHAVGFHNNKTKYLQQAAAICRDAHGGDIPDTIEGLVSLPGVGPKMAHLCLSAAWGRTEGIGVDVHVHRITNLWGWHGKAGSKNPEDTRVKLESWLPKDRWREINTLLVGLGQTVCLPVGRRCGDCELGLKGLCRAAERKKVLEGRRARESVTVNARGHTHVKVDHEVADEAQKEFAVSGAGSNEMDKEKMASVKEEFTD
ncbi:DNA glycosylase [Xylaria bambusicola]|uniref:DNA glycosylase n=1 Tax=Xylaria bambusicola TaxID=326684 RepID=UPI0020072A4E|nr:DNA glycosylase [Xylaria bambusicola]KAI0514587.1 DNA glycosylase [Xylaria bambusicola]